MLFFSNCLVVFYTIEVIFYDKHLKIKCFLHNVGDAISNKT